MTLILCVCMCVTFLSAGMHTYVWACQRLTLGVFLNCFSPLCFWNHLPLNLKLTRLNLYLHLLRTGIMVPYQHTLLLKWELGIWTQVSMLTEQALHWAFFLASTLTFLTSWQLYFNTNVLLRAYEGQLPVVNWWCQFSKCWRPPNKFPWDITAYDFSTIPIISVVLKLSRFEMKQSLLLWTRMLGEGRD